MSRSVTTKPQEQTVNEREVLTTSNYSVRLDKSEEEKENTQNAAEKPRCCKKQMQDLQVLTKVNTQKKKKFFELYLIQTYLIQTFLGKNQACLAQNVRMYLSPPISIWASVHKAVFANFELVWKSQIVISCE